MVCIEVEYLHYVAMVQTRELRPKGLPKFRGNSFFLIGYRIFVRYINKAGKRLRGLYILKSETDKKKMEWLGNIFTHYNYSTTDIQLSIYDARGTLVQDLIQYSNHPSGNFRINFQLASTSDGLFYVVFQKGGKVETKKVVMKSSP